VTTAYAGLVFDINDTYSAYTSYTEIFQPQTLKDRNGSYLDPVDGKSQFGLALNDSSYGGALPCGLAARLGCRQRVPCGCSSGSGSRAPSAP